MLKRCQEKKRPRILREALWSAARPRAAIRKEKTSPLKGNRGQCAYYFIFSTADGKSRRETSRQGSGLFFKCRERRGGRPRHWEVEEAGGGEFSGRKAAKRQGYRRSPKDAAHHGFEKLASF